MAITTSVFILVETKGINQNNKDNKIVLYDNLTDSELPGDPKDYTSTVWKENEIIWLAFPNPFEKKPGKVALTKIEKKKDSNNHILKDDEYTPDSRGRVVGYTSDHYVPGNEGYNIWLEINGESYMIDPKLQMHP
jgi:hypothetical protein